MIFSNFSDSYFSSYGDFGEFSLTFTAAVSAVAQRSLSGRSAVAQRSLSGRSAVAQRSLSGRSAVAQRSLSGRSAVAQRSLSGRSAVAVFTKKGLAVVDFGPAWHCYSGQRAAYASGTTLTDRRHDEQCNVAEIGAVNMGEIGAVRKRSR